MKRMLTVLVATATLSVPFAAPALASPGYGETDPAHAEPRYVGPYNDDWYCVYNDHFGRQTCSYAPGQGEPDKLLVECSWWQWLCWLST